MLHQQGDSGHLRIWISPPHPSGGFMVAKTSAHGCRAWETTQVTDPTAWQEAHWVAPNIVKYGVGKNHNISPAELMCTTGYWLYVDADYNNDTLYIVEGRIDDRIDKEGASLLPIHGDLILSIMPDGGGKYYLHIVGQPPKPYCTFREACIEASDWVHRHGESKCNGSSQHLLLSGDELG